MTVIKETVTVLCVLAVGFGCIQMFVPKGGTDKSTHGLFCLIMILLVIASASKGMRLDISLPKTETSTVSASIDVDQTITTYAAGQIEREIKNTLQNDGVPLEDVQVCMDISDNNSISISKIHITLKGEKEAYKNIVQNKVYTLTGVYPQISLKG